MGGQYIDTIFKDRNSEHPNRRRLVPVIDPSTDQPIDNLYDIIREEGEINTTGTPFNANTMNTFNNHISKMFPVSIVNGGTGHDNKQDTLEEFGIETEVNDSNNQIELIGESEKGKRAIFWFGNKIDGVNLYRQSVFYKFGKFCIVSILITSKRGDSVAEGDNIQEKYLKIKNLPYKAYRQSKVAGSAQNIYMPCCITTFKVQNNKREYGNYLYDPSHRPITSTICYLDSLENEIRFQESTGQNAVYVEQNTFVDIRLSGVYRIAD